MDPKPKTSIMPTIKVPALSEHGGELFLLGLIAVGVLVLLACIVGPWGVSGGVKQAIVDMTPFLLLLQSIVNAVKDRWTARLQGQSNVLLGQAGPVGDGDKPTGKPGDPVAVTEETAP